MTESTERAHKLAEFIHGLNDQRQTLERSVYRAPNKLAHETGDPRDLPALVLADRGWHPGVSINEAAIDPFRKDFCAHAAAHISDEERIAELFVDAETPLAALTHQT